MKLQAQALLFCFIVMASPISLADTYQPRSPEKQPEYHSLFSVYNENKIAIKFIRGLQLELNEKQQLNGLNPSAQNSLNAILQAHQAELIPMFEASGLELRALTSRVQERTEHELTDLSLYYLISVSDKEQSPELAYQLSQLETVEFAMPVRRTPAPSSIGKISTKNTRLALDLPPVTQDLSSMQRYKTAAPVGIDVKRKYGLRGMDGRNVTIVDVEQGWILDHEDLTTTGKQLLAPVDFDDFVPNTYWGTTHMDHGTAVAGILAAAKNNHGITGIVPKADLLLSPEYYISAASGQPTFNRYDAILRAIMNMERGDVLLLEAQVEACRSNGNLGPAEWDRVVFDLVDIATAEGIIVVAAAGNGALNLDSRDCEYRFGRGIDSGAIIVGASYSDLRYKLPTSSYGRRVNVHSWGEKVTTLGYGYGGISPVQYDNRQSYTDNFDGTSSATAIVAGAVAAIQSRIKYCQRKPLNSREMRSLLIRTGTRQRFPSAQFEHIGPQPNVREALLEANVVDYCLNLPETATTPLVVNQQSGSFGGSRTVTVKNMNNQPALIAAQLSNSGVSPILSLSHNGLIYIPAFSTFDIEVSLAPSYNIKPGYYTTDLEIHSLGGGHDPYTYEIPVTVIP